MHVIDVHEKQIYRQLDFVHDVMTKYVCMCACFSLGQEVFAWHDWPKWGHDVSFHDKVCREQGMRVIAETPAIHARQAL